MGSYDNQTGKTDDGKDTNTPLPVFDDLVFPDNHFPDLDEFLESQNHSEAEESDQEDEYEDDSPKLTPAQQREQNLRSCLDLLERSLVNGEVPGSTCTFEALKIRPNGPFNKVKNEAENYWESAEGIIIPEDKFKDILVVCIIFF